MPNVKKATTKNAAKCNCGCGTCSCGCEKNACRCQETNCQCGCGKPAVGR
jgi:hypothetical protein